MGLDIEELQVNDTGEQTDVDDTDRDKHGHSCEDGRDARCPCPHRIGTEGT